MNQWLVLYRKEMTEMVRNAKWIWVPLVFLLLGIMQPVTTYYTPQILKNMGGLPEGAVIDIPLPKAGEVLAKTLSQFGSLGVLILVLASMGIVAAERASGTAGMILLKPVPYSSFITAKWAGLMTLTLVSFGVGFAGAWYYTGLLIDWVPFDAALKGFLLYTGWLAFIVTLTLTASALMRGNGAIAFSVMLTAALLSILTRLLDKAMRWSPSRLADHASLVLVKGVSGPGLLLSAVVTAAAGAALLAAAVNGFKRKSLLE